MVSSFDLMSKYLHLTVVLFKGSVNFGMGVQLIVNSLQLILVYIEGKHLFGMKTSARGNQL